MLVGISANASLLVLPLLAEQDLILLMALIGMIFSSMRLPLLLELNNCKAGIIPALLLSI
jgi:hypothetical protein